MLIPYPQIVKDNMNDVTDIQHDLLRNDFGDPEIAAAYERLRAVHKSKGLPYTELFSSKLFGTLKYLLKELHDSVGTVLITDLDTNQTFKVYDSAPKRNDRRRVIKDWIESTNSRAA